MYVLVIYSPNKVANVVEKLVLRLHMLVLSTCGNLVYLPVALICGCHCVFAHLIELLMCGGAFSEGLVFYTLTPRTWFVHPGHHLY